MPTPRVRQVRITLVNVRGRRPAACLWGHGCEHPARWRMRWRVNGDWAEALWLCEDHVRQHLLRLVTHHEQHGKDGTGGP